MLIVDANVVISALIPGSKSIELLFNLNRAGHRLLSPEFLLEEVSRNIPDLERDSGLTLEELKSSFKLLLKRIEIVPKSEYSQFLEEAKRISPHLKDSPYFALSLAFNKSPIWSREPRLKRQKVVKVLSDSEVKEYFGLTAP